MRWCFLLPLAFSVTACATAPDTSAPTADPDVSVETTTNVTDGRLAPQTLRPGECGLFGYDPEARFVFFATPRRGTYVAEGQVRQLEPSGEFPNLYYETINVALGRAESLVDGQRYPEARLQETLADGFVRVLPLRVIETCTVPDRAPL